MTDGFAVSPADIAGRASTFRDASAELQAALELLQSSLAHLGNVTGTDDPGRKFAARYDPNTATIVANTTSLVRGVLAFHEGLLASADNYAGMEAQNATNAERS